MAAGELEIQDHPLLYSEFQAKLGYIRLCVKREKKEVKKEEGDIGGQAWWVILVTPALGGRGPKIKSSGVQGQAQRRRYLASKTLAISIGQKYGWVLRTD